MGASPPNPHFLYFNSIKVRLELSVSPEADYNSLFQFHKGTIRTQRCIAEEPFTNEFQFHKGTIRTTTHRPRRIYKPISIP